MKQVQYLRKDAVIRSCKTNKDVVFDSIALAKKASHKIQLNNDGVLGLGIVRVVGKLPVSESNG